MKMNILKYLSVFFSYFIVDASYQALFGIKFAQKAQEAAGIKDIYAEGLQNPILMLIWFIIMTIGIVKLAVEPAVKEKNIKGAAWRGLLLGVTSYSTLALPNGWSIVDYPMALVMEVALEGFLFAPAAASFTTWWILRKKD